jgi:hypothetical protein
MNSPSLRQKRAALVALVALALAGCGDDRYAYGYYPIICDSGVDTGTVETDAILDLDPGRGVGATAEYSGDGAWRFAVACDSLFSGYGCRWQVLVSAIDGTIESFEPEGLELYDVVQRYPTVPGSTEEDGVLLDTETDVGIDAFTLLATPGAGMRVEAVIGDYCGGPYLFWTDDGRVRNSTTSATDLFPSAP